jgi:tripartite-type tricarboxylate transporter receptor subunit TctC
MKTRRSTLRALGSLSVAALLPATRTSFAQANFPTRPVRVITPFPPGAGPDAALRILSEQLAKKWNQAVVVENKPGGNGFIAVNAFKQASADGHDLIQLDNSHTTTHPTTFSKLPYDVERDFAPLAMMLRTSFFVAVSAQSAWKTIDDLIEAARASPGRITYGSWFIGSPGHLGALRLASMQKLQMTHVPYKDFGQLYSAVASKEVDWALGSNASAGNFERGGKLRFIAVAAAAREAQYPNVPATAEIASVKGFEVSGWAGLFAPRAIAAPLRDRLAADITDALATREVSDKLRGIGFEIPRLTPDAFSELIRRETVAWAAQIREANLRLD